MVVRIWSVRIAEGRIDEFERYIRENIAGIYRQESGMVCSVRARSDHDWRTITLWNEPEPAETLDASPAFTAALQGLKDAGLMDGEPRTEVLELRGALVPDPEALLEILGT